MSAVTNAVAPMQWPRWAVWLRRELAPFPGRKAMTVRLVITVVLVTIISLALQVPQLAFSAFFVFFVTKENRVLTALTGVLMILGNSIATLTSLFLYRYTFDYPELRIPVMAGFVFTGMFLSRVFVIGPLGFAIGFFIALMQIIAEGAPNTDALVRGQLWLWVAVVYPIALTVIINQILLPAHPWTMLVRTLTQRLGTTSSALRRVIKDGMAGGQNNPALLELATRGSSPLCALLNFAESKDAELKHRHASLIAMIAASEHLITATASLELREPYPISENDFQCAKALLVEMEHLCTVMQERHPILSPSNSTAVTATLPQLRELQFAAGSFRNSLNENYADLVSSSKPAKKPLFVTDTFTNPTYIRFALKVTLAAMASYLIYTGLNWPGISTAFITCCFIALENTGATMRKGWLRLIGCTMGGLFGFLALVFLVPHMESVVSLILLVAVGSALAGWVAAGTDRISYAGLQAAFAFYLCVFQGFAPEVNFVTIRDRLVGIVLGITVSSIVFHYIWREHAVDRLRATLARVLRNLSQLLLIPKIGVSIEAETKTADKVRGDITKDLDDTLRLSELIGFENTKTDRPENLSPSVLERLASNTQALCLMTTALLRKTKLEEWQRLEEPVQQAETVLRTGAAEELQHVAAFVETGLPSKSNGLEPVFTTWNQTVAQVTENDRPRLVRRLIEQIRLLTRNV
jgi:multidrug resistance protein MdtO